MSNDEGGSAFPHQKKTDDPGSAKYIREATGCSMQEATRLVSGSPGMSLRDYYAGKAMEAMVGALFGDDKSIEIMGSGGYTEVNRKFSIAFQAIAKQSFEQADQMFRARRGEID